MNMINEGLKVTMDFGWKTGINMNMGYGNPALQAVQRIHHDYYSMRTFEIPGTHGQGLYLVNCFG